MRQVPPVYVVIGNGRVATHMCYYLSDLAIEHYQWSSAYHDVHSLKHHLTNATHI
jgi:2-dehydropantoate 2-reductase